MCTLCHAHLNVSAHSATCSLARLPLVASSGISGDGAADAREPRVANLESSGAAAADADARLQCASAVDGSAADEAACSSSCSCSCCCRCTSPPQCASPTQAKPDRRTCDQTRVRRRVARDWRPRPVCSVGDLKLAGGASPRATDWYKKIHEKIRSSPICAYTCYTAPLHYTHLTLHRPQNDLHSPNKDKNKDKDVHRNHSTCPPPPLPLTQMQPQAT